MFANTAYSEDGISVSLRRADFQLGGKPIV